MPLHIAIDARRIRDFGVGTYLRNLVRGLAKIDRENRYTLVRAPGDDPEFENLPGNFASVVYSKPDRTYPAQIRYSIFLKRLGADVYHLPINVVPMWMPKPYIVTTHDVGNLIFSNRRGLRDNYDFRRLRRGLLLADCVIAVSAATRRDLESVVGIPGERIRTIYNAPDPAFTERVSPAVACVGDQGVVYAPDMQRILDRYQIDYPFLLYAGRTNPRKNIPRLVEAFAVVRGEVQSDPRYRDLRLIIIGDEISKYPRLRHAVIQSRVEHQVRFLGFVPIETLRVFYQAAAAFVFPSLYEGFGLPPLEAMACGTPVVTSNVSSLPEVVGDAAAIVNPENVFDIARGIREVLLDQDLRARLIRRGFEQLKHFSWEQAVAQVLATYVEVGSKRPRR
jgi:glycosyltransferase involved in cell wall biosynthesis